MEQTISPTITNREFIRKLLKLVLPMMLQSAISQFVSMLDNIMVGHVGTIEMTGVTVANQMFIVYNMIVFGAVAGIGIYESQFVGKRDNDGVRYSLRFKLYLTLGVTAVFILVMLFFGRQLMSMYLMGDGDSTDAAAALTYALKYMSIMLIGTVPFALTQSYAGTLKHSGVTVPPMLAGLAAVFVNLALNYILIYGKFGAPVLGVTGAAIATVISRFVEITILVIYTHTTTSRNVFASGLYKSLKVPYEIGKSLLKTGLPLMINEAIWVFAFTFAAQCYSTRGLNVVAAYNIVNTFWNVFSVAFITTGSGVGILMGQLIGAGRSAEARKYSRFAVLISLFVGAIMGFLFFLLRRLIPGFYNTTSEVKSLATSFIIVCAVLMPLDGVINSCYFTMRSGGQMLITMLFDSVFMWAILIPVAYYLCHYTELDIVNVYFLSQATGIIKAIVGVIFVFSGSWIKDLVKDIDTSEMGTGDTFVSKSTE